MKKTTNFASSIGTNASKLVLALMITGCTVNWTDNTPVSVFFKDESIPEGSKRAFERRIKRDVDTWATTMIEAGCPAPFYYTDDKEIAEKIWLVPKSQWTKQGVGVYNDYPGEIFILALGDGTLDVYADDPTWNVALHELGHALGLEHSAYIEGDPSIMCVDPEYPADPNVPLPERDIRDAACALGCGPCHE